MTFTLLPLSRAQLEALSASRIPAEFASRAENGSLPPAFVAVRALKLGDQGQPFPWSTSFLIVRDEGERFVGACGFKSAPQAGRVEVGYGVAPAARQSGAATAALCMLTALAFEAGAKEVLAEILPDNTASTRVVQKAGFLQIGSRIDEDSDYVYQWLFRSGT